MRAFNFRTKIQNIHKEKAQTDFRIEKEEACEFHGFLIGKELEILIYKTKLQEYILSIFLLQAK